MNMFKASQYYLICAVCLTVNTNGESINKESIDEKVKHQVQLIHWHTLIDSDEWGYTIETQLDNGNGKLQQRIQRYDPNLELEKQWQLIEQDNSLPSKAIQHEYDKTQSAIRNEGDNYDSESIVIVHMATLALETDTQDYQVFSFKPKLPMFEEQVNEVFDGKLYFNKSKNHIDKLSIKATEAFSPDIVIDVEKYSMNIEVSKINEQLHVTGIESIKSGSAFIFTSFDEVSTRKLSSFVANEVILK